MFHLIIIIIIIIIIIVWKGYSKIETQYIHKNYWRIFLVTASRQKLPRPSV